MWRVEGGKGGVILGLVGEEIDRVSQMGGKLGERGGGVKRVWCHEFLVNLFYLFSFCAKTGFRYGQG